MSVPYRILMVEDSASDAELVKRQLTAASIKCEFSRVDNSAAYLQGLEQFRPDLIMSDLTMPVFSGMEALNIARRLTPHIPFIFVSGTIGEERAITALKEGATDYVLKHNLLRLPAAVVRALGESSERTARRLQAEQLRDNERQYRALFQLLPHPSFVVDLRTLHFLAVNDMASMRYGFTREEFLAMTLKDLHLEQDQQPVLVQMARPHIVGGNAIVWTHKTKSRAIQVSIAYQDMEFEHKPATLMVASILPEQ